MKAKSLLKVLSLFLVISLLVFSLSSNFSFVNAKAKATGAAWDDVTQFDNKGNTGLDQSAQNVLGAIISVVQIVGTGVAIIMLLVLAMKYMIAAPGDRADIKKHAVVYVVGAVILFGASGILGIIKEFTKNIK